MSHSDIPPCGDEFITAYSQNPSQLTASDVNFAVIRPLVFKYARLKNPAVVYACLVVRSRFLSLAGEDMAYTGVMLARADMCEILAMKLLNRFSSSKIQLTSVLMTSWDPLAGAPEHVLDEVKTFLGGGDDDEISNPQCALEVRPLLHPNSSCPTERRLSMVGPVRWRLRQWLSNLLLRPSLRPL